jgi:hypothetical protein
MTPMIITLVIILMTGGQEYERYLPQSSIVECLSEAANVLNKAVKLPAEKADEAEIGAGCVIKINPGQPA